VFLKVTSPVQFGNANQNISIFLGADVWITSPVLNGDSSFSTTNNISLPSNGVIAALIDDGDFSTVSGIKTAATTDINVTAADPCEPRFVLRNTKLGAATEVGSQTLFSERGFISAQKVDQTAGNHKTWLRYGTLQTDATIYNTAAPSMRMTPNNASGKLESATFGNGIKVAVASGATKTISVYVRKSSAGDGAAYNGNHQRLIQKANPALGQSSDVVLDTAAAATGSWEQLTASSSTASGDDGVWEFVVDCDGTTGWTNVDDWSVS